jgi:hypothetical protein
VALGTEINQAAYGKQIKRAGNKMPALASVKKIITTT